MRARLARDFERFRAGLPPDWPLHVRDAYRVNLGARYLGEPIAHPIGKGSGQLSLHAGQLERDAAAGLAFVVLKTVIAEDASGMRTMGAWAVPESRMTVERRRTADDREGWTVTWKGRGWDRGFDEYLALLRAGRDLARGCRMPVVPSVKYHLPPLGADFHDGEYRHTTASLAAVWGEGPLLLEKDFSPTLAGDTLAAEQAQVLRWVREIPARIRRAAPHGTRIALKLMNARFDDAFQVDMLVAAREAGADAAVVFNRLFDPVQGAAYGGWELSDRNLRVLDRYAAAVLRDPPASPPVPLVGTGNVCSGDVILEYACRGCESVELHTFFQLPLAAYPSRAGSRTARALHALVFDPGHGLVAGMLRLAESGALAPRGGELHFLDVVDAHRPR